MIRDQADQANAIQHSKWVSVSRQIESEIAKAIGFWCSADDVPAITANRVSQDATAGILEILQETFPDRGASA
jgi:hypothetical protein